MMKTNINTPGTYEAPVTFTVLIEQEQSFLGSTLQNMGKQTVIEEDFV